MPTLHISSLQLNKDMNKDEMTYVMAMWLEDVAICKVPLPKEGYELLFWDIMPPKPPKNLPPKWDVDHMIELELGAKPPTRAP